MQLLKGFPSAILNYHLYYGCCCVITILIKVYINHDSFIGLICFDPVNQFLSA